MPTGTGLVAAQQRVDKPDCRAARQIPGIDYRERIDDRYRHGSGDSVTTLARQIGSVFGCNSDLIRPGDQPFKVSRRACSIAAAANRLRQ